jgi:L1 cell adhesion molecule like protein
VDKSLRARHQTLLSTNKSLHYFHTYAVMDRVDLSSCSDEAPSGETAVDIEKFLPSRVEVATILSRFHVFISR